MSQLLETDRLMGIPITMEDYDDLYRLNTDPDVAKTMGGTRTTKQTQERIETWIQSWKSKGYGVWVLREKTTGKFVGRAGLLDYLIDGTLETELLYALMPDFWNRGLATEIGKRIIAYAFEEIGLEELVCFTLHENKASQRVVEKLGFQYEKDIMHVNLPHFLYRLKVPERI